MAEQALLFDCQDCYPKLLIQAIDSRKGNKGTLHIVHFIDLLKPQL